ncbi:hypothetical protein BJ944DRAFT_253340 [Cunninghamella echinulata]|nr:hypothetical protein BJ944DRAFT_253340 [Cunninghamella echinulata]
MGRLQDNQYITFKKSKKSDKIDLEKKRDLLYQQFCPPLDSSLIETIWTDSFNYNQSYAILKELAQETDNALDAELEHSQSQFEKFGLNSNDNDLDIDEQGDTYSLDGSTEDNDGNNNKNDHGSIATASTNVSENTASTLTTQSSTSYDNPEQRDDVEFLSTCFPTLDHQQLIDILQSNDNDVEKATDILLNTAFLDTDEGTDLASLADDDDILFYGTKKKNKSSKDKKNTNNNNNKKGKQVIWTSRNTDYQQQRQQQRDTNYDHESSAWATIPFNYWHQYDDTVGKIHQIFPTIPKFAIHGCVQRCKGNTIASVISVMSKHPNTQPILHWQLASNLDQVEQGIKIGLVDRTPEEVKRIAIGVVVNSASKYDVNQMIKQGVDFALTFEKEQKELANRIELMKNRMNHYNNQNSSSSGPNNDMPVIPDYLLINNQQFYTEEDPELCRMVAMDLILNRNELFQKAADSYRQARNNKNGERGIAFFYSDEARQLDKKAKEWNMRAARAYIREKR